MDATPSILRNSDWKRSKIKNQTANNKQQRSKVKDHTHLLVVLLEGLDEHDAFVGRDVLLVQHGGEQPATIGTRV